MPRSTPCPIHAPSARPLRVRGGRIVRHTLLVLLVGCTLAACSRPINPALIEDAQTAARVKTAIVNDQVVGVHAIEVRVDRGVAHLSGRVGSTEEAQRLVEIVRAVPGVRDVQSGVQVGDNPAPPVARARPRALDEVAFEPPDDPRLFAIGGSFSWTVPGSDTLGSYGAIGPLMRFGSPSGTALNIDFNWMSTELLDEGRRSLGRIRVRPIMAGAGYSFRGERASLSLSLVGGYAFNSVVVDEASAAGGVLALTADNSLAWRPGASVWVDVNRRIAINFSAGYLLARPRVAFLERGEVVRRTVRADTFLFSTGIAYKLF